MARRRLPPTPPVDEPEDPTTRNWLWQYRMARHVEHLASGTGGVPADASGAVDEVLAQLGAHLGYPVDRAAAERLLAERRARLDERHRAWRERTGR